jgi:ankyrin repeat protein
MAAITQKADPNAKDNQQTPALFLTMNGKLESMCIKLIDANANINTTVTKDGTTTTPLAAAKAMNLSSVVNHIQKLEQQLISLYSSLSAAIKNSDSKASLHIISDRLLSRHFDPQHRVEGCTALHHACIFKLSEVAFRLIDLKSDLNAQDDTYGGTPLMFASQRRLNDICMRLIQHKADINIIDKYGKTALMLAKESKCDSTVIELLTKKH